MNPNGTLTENNIIRTNNFEVEVKFYEEYIDPTSDAWKEFDEGIVFNDLVFVPGSEAVRYVKFENPNAFPVKFDLVLLRMDETLNTGLADSLLVYGKDGITGTVDYTDLNALAPNLQALNETAGYGEMAHMLQTVVATGTSDAPGYGIAALSIRLPESYSDPNGMRATFKLRVIATQYVPVESTTSTETAASERRMPAFTAFVEPKSIRMTGTERTPTPTADGIERNSVSLTHSSIFADASFLLPDASAEDIAGIRAVETADARAIGILIIVFVL